MLSMISRLKVEKSRGRSKPTLGLGVFLTLSCWTSVTFLLWLAGMLIAYEPGGDGDLGNSTMAIVWYWAGISVIGGLFFALSRRRRLAWLWKSGSKPFFVFEILRAVLFGLVNGVLISFLFHMNTVRNDAVSLFDHYTYARNQVPQPLLDNTLPNAEWFDESQALHADKKQVWCERAQVSQGFFLNTHTSPTQSNQVLAFMLGSTFLHQRHANGCVSDQQWLDEMKQTHHQASAFPGPDAFIQQKLAWTYVYKLLFTPSEILVDRLKPTPANLCARMATNDLGFQGSAELCADYFANDELATLADIDRIRTTLKTQADKRKDTP